MEKIFNGIAISTKEELISACERWKIASPEAKTKENFEALNELVDNYNKFITYIAYKELSEKDVIPFLANVHIAKGKNPRSTARNCLLAINYPQWVINLNEDNTITLRSRKVAVTLAGYFNFCVSRETQKKADNKLSKDDKAKILRSIIPVEVEREVKLFTVSAVDALNIFDSNFDTAIKMNENEAKLYGGKPSKAIAEKRIKALAEVCGMSKINFRSCNGISLYHDCFKKVKGMFIVSDTMTILDALILEARYAISEIYIPVDDRANIITVKEDSDILIF